MIIAALLVEGLGRHGRSTTAHGVEGVEALQVVGLAFGQACGVDAVFLGQGSKIADDLVPLVIALLTHAFAPLLGYIEAIVPISKFKGMIEREVLRHAFLHGGGSFQIEFFCFGVIADEVGHKLGSLFYLPGIFSQRFFRGIGAIHFLGHIDVVGLLPDEERARVRRCFASPGIGHLHPANALEALSLGNLAGFGVGHGVVPLEHLLYGLRAIPKSEVDHVPPGHLQMRAAEPSVVGEACFLWRQVVGAVHLRQVLREHHTALQFLGTRVGALREVYDAAFLPPAVPRFQDAAQFLVEDESPLGGRRLVFVFGLECQHVISSREFEVMAVALLQLGFSLPREGKVVAGGVDRMLY